MRTSVAFTTIIIAVTLAGCAGRAPQSPAVADTIRKSLDDAGLRDVSVAQDRDKGIVTLGGHVATDADKSRAESAAQSLATNQVVANQIAILPAGDIGATKTMYSDLDKGIENNLDAALIGGGYPKGIHRSVKSGVVTLTGSVDNEAQRAQVATIAQAVPNTQQVVNEIQTTHQKATSTR